MKDSIQAPIEKGEQLGTITYSLNGSNISTVNLVAENSIEKIDLLNMAKFIYNKWFNLLRT